MKASVLHLQLRTSPRLAGALLLVHGAALFFCVTLLPNAGMAALAAGAIGASAFFHVRRDALRLSAGAATELRLGEGGWCELRLRNGQTLTGTVEGTTFVTVPLIVINVRIERSRRRHAVILLSDSASAEELRRVRVWLRYRSRSANAASGTL